MRTLLVLALVAVGCQKVDTAEHSAAKVAATEPAKPAAMPANTTPDLATQPAEPMAKEGTCTGTGCSEAACGGEGGEKPTWANLPEGTKWTPLHVTGMKCGHCAEKIERALAKVDGVKGVRIDLDTQKVSIAVADGKDARMVAKPVIDSLGYHVD